jgi:hypothetical protein
MKNAEEQEINIKMDENIKKADIDINKLIKESLNDELFK